MNMPPTHWTRKQACRHIAYFINREGPCGISGYAFSRLWGLDSSSVLEHFCPHHLLSLLSDKIILQAIMYCLSKS